MASGKNSNPYLSLSFSLCLVPSRVDFFSIFFKNAVVRSTPVWLARHINTKSTSANSSAKSLSLSDCLNYCSPYFLEIIRATSPTSSVKMAIFVNSLKYRTPVEFIHLSTVFWACSIVILS